MFVVSEEACFSKIPLTTGDGHVLALARVDRRKCPIILMFYSKYSDNNVIIYVLYICTYTYIYICVYFSWRARVISILFLMVVQLLLNGRCFHV